MQDDYKIWSAVGLGMPNNPSDVIIVQQMLNNVAVDEGGPMSPLDVDGAMSQELTRAIRNFQRIQLEAHEVDGKVKPGGSTMEALCGFNRGMFGPTPFPIVPLLARSTVLQCPHGGTVSVRSITKKPVLQPDDSYTVAGCTFYNSCSTVQWMDSGSLNTGSSGLCLTDDGTAQGSVIVARS